MPRSAHKRGKNKSEKGSNGNQRNYLDKVCIVSAVDKNDNCLLKIGGKGKENRPYYKKIQDYIKEGSTIVCDSNSSLLKFVEDIECKADPIVPKPTRNNYISSLGNSLSSINQVHQQVSEMIYRTHGVSLRHLQGYLNWIIFKRIMSFKVERCHWKSESYKKVIKEKTDIGAVTVHHLPLPFCVENDIAGAMVS